MNQFIYSQASHPDLPRLLDRGLDGLGEFPPVGFFTTGEIHKNTQYGFTGVLCVFK